MKKKKIKLSRLDVFLEKRKKRKELKKLEKENKILQKEKKLTEQTIQLKKDKAQAWTDIKKHKGKDLTSLEEAHIRKLIGWKKRLVLKFKKVEAIAVFMFLENGKGVDFLIGTPEKGKFEYKDGDYVLDPEASFYMKSLKFNAYIFHEGISVPFRLEFPLDKIKETLEKINDAHASINPQNLKRFVESEFIQKVMIGADLGNDLAFIRTMTMVCALLSLGAVVISLAVLLNVSGG